MTADPKSPSPVDLIVQHPSLGATAVAAFSQVLGRSPDRCSNTLARWHRVSLAQAVLREIADAEAVDANLIAADLQLSAFGLLAMDMDSTLITVECIDELADFAGRKAEVAAITEAAMRGEISDYTDSLGRRLKALAGLPASVLEQVYAERIRTSPGAGALLDGVRAAGLSTLLVSGGFTWFTDRLADMLGIDKTRANRLELSGGQVTGRLAGSAWGPARRNDGGTAGGHAGTTDPDETPGPIVDAEIKRQTLAQRCRELGIAPSATIAIGDGSNDLPMLRAAGLAVAWRAKPLVRDEMRHALDHSGLDAILDWFRH